MLKLIAIVIPLGLDAFAATASLAISGISASDRRRVAIIIPLFEAGMPLLGVAIGAPIQGVGGAEKIAAGLLVIVALLIFREARDGEPDGQQLEQPGQLSMLKILALGLAISVDELGVGISLGLLGLPLAATLMLIAFSAVVMSQLGLRLGSRLGERAAERAQLLSGTLLLGIAAVLFLTE